MRGKGHTKKIQNDFAAMLGDLGERVKTLLNLTRVHLAVWDTYHILFGSLTTDTSKSWNVPLQEQEPPITLLRQVSISRLYTPQAYHKITFADLLRGAALATYFKR